MSLRFIIGRAGAGKTRACLLEIGRELKERPFGAPLIWLVPEQATFQAERALASLPGLKGFMRAQVLSFKRLAFRILQEEGGLARTHLGELGRQMLLRRLLQVHRQELKAFAPSCTRAGFAGVLAAAVSELKTCCLTPGDLAAAENRLRALPQGGPLADRLHDLRLVYAAFLEHLRERFLDPDDYTDLLAQRLPGSRLVLGASVWIDGFTGFTRQEYRVLKALLRSARRVSVTVCADPHACCDRKALDEDNPFFSSLQMRRRLTEMALQEGVRLEEPLLLTDPPPRFVSGTLAYLESNFFNSQAPPYCGPSADVVLAAAASREAEVEGAARAIVSLCREQNYRWREIAVFLRDIGPYAEIVERVFAAYGIPVFIDLKKPVLHHPLVELVRSALGVVAEKWSLDSVTRFLKSEFSPLAREEADVLENYAKAHGICGEQWYESLPWRFRRALLTEEDEGESSSAREETDTSRINELRKRGVEELAVLDQRLKSAACVREMAGALWDFLERLDVPQKIGDWCSEAERAGKSTEAGEHSQVWGLFCSLLDQVVETMGGEALNAADFADVLEAGFEGMRLGLIPPGLDQVMVCSLDRSRAPEVRAAFVLGAVDGELPSRGDSGGLFGYTDREALHTAGLELSPASGPFLEQLAVYTALTRSKERLFISWPLAGSTGEALPPSPVVARLKKLLPGICEKFWPAEPPFEGQEALEFVSMPAPTLSCLAVQMQKTRQGRELEGVWRDVYSWFAQSGYRDRLEKVVSAVFFTNRAKQLSKDTARSLYGSPFCTGVSSLEKFWACPFSFFISRGLRLKDREVFRLDPLACGEFFHAALKLFGERLVEAGKDLGEISPEEVQEIAAKAAEDLLPRLKNEFLLAGARRQHIAERLKSVVVRAAQILAEHARRGAFKPIGFEIAFGEDRTGSRTKSFPPLVFKLGDGEQMHLRGRIDRLEAARGANGYYLRVIDFKSGRPSLDLREVWYGLKLQLLAYMAVALEYAGTLVGCAGECKNPQSPPDPGTPLKLTPAAVLYFPLRDPLVAAGAGAGIHPGVVEEEILKELRTSGIVLAEPEAVKTMDSCIKKYSVLIPAGLDASGRVLGASAVNLEVFQQLLEYTREKMAIAGDKILGGATDISPCQWGSFTACQRCSYRPVCQFDPLLQGKDQRVLPKLAKEEVLKMAAARREGERE